MKVRVEMSRRGGRWDVTIGGIPARVEEADYQAAPRVALKLRHLKLLGVQRYRQEEYFLLNGRTLAHGKRHLGFVTIAELALPGFPPHPGDFVWRGYLECKPLSEKQGGGA